mmetsp:Transcript_8937/g.23246  ORF Transcript_8937/g.23246 Transcript_8937/m.23246 type:complete len:662 (+) Transcript_8937:75-2060(+)
MDIKQQVAVAALTCPEGLRTVRTLLSNLASHPEEHKYRSVSEEALRRRGLTADCFSILLCCGFEAVNGRFEMYGLNPQCQPIYLEAMQAVIAALELGAPSTHGAAVPGVVADADALVQMGFTHAQVQQALDQAPPGSDMDEVLRILLAPKEEGVVVAATRDVPVAGQASWECLICYTSDCDGDWSCPTGHRFCVDCMLHHVDAVPFPRCPLCEYSLGEEDLVDLGASSQRLAAFREGLLTNAVDTMAQDGEMLVRCSRPECPNAVLMQRVDRQMFSCHVCDAAPFCTRCRQAPFHFHGACEQVQPLREHWVRWINGGREEYYGRARIAAQNDSRNRVLHEALERHRELEADEQWKVQNCRLCPSCSRPISKVDGCDSMKCGENYHGGDQQPGCGTQFDWAHAAPYVAHVERRELPQMHKDHIQMRGRNAFHPFTDCALCGRCGIDGLRFRCIHCPSFDVCPSCEPRLADVHEADHVFEVVFESDFRFSWLPRGTRVRIVRAGELLPKALIRTSVDSLEGRFGVVAARRRPPLEGYAVDLELGAGQVVVDGHFLEPLLTSRREAEELLMKTMEQDGEEAHQASASDQLVAPEPLQGPTDLVAPHEALAWVFADDSPLTSEAEELRTPRRRPPAASRRVRRQPRHVQRPRPRQQPTGRIEEAV